MNFITQAQITYFSVKSNETLNGRLPLEDSSDLDDFWTELILMTRAIVWDTLRFS